MHDQPFQFGQAPSADDAESRYRSLVELSADIAFTLEVHFDGVAVWQWVAPHLRLQGFTVESFPVQTDFMDAVHPDDRGSAALWLTALSNNREEGAEFRLVSQQGTERLLRLRGRALWDDEERRAVAITAAGHDITDSRQADMALQQRALYDYLTDLPNRALLLDRLRHTIREAGRRNGAFALLMFDMNRFKLINDTFGHAAGDLVLQEVARRLTGTLRASDTIARLGGDEFAIILNNMPNQERVEKALERIIAALHPAMPFGDTTLQLRASLGIAVFPHHGTNADVLMRCADTAMYVSKRAGMDWAFYHPDQELGDHGRLTLLADLRQAIEQDELTIFYLPEVHVRTGNVTWVEALLRWEHPTRGLLSPAEFIPLAEQHGHILPLTMWSLRRAVGQLAAWRKAGHELGVAVNLSPKVLKLAPFVDELRNLLAEAKIDPSLLKLEINEDALMTDPKLIVGAVAALRELGISIAVDDFGRQYSSLNYLRELQVTELKIDRSFVTDMATDDYDAVIVRSTIELAHRLGIDVVAEGVESAETWDLLDALHCDIVQGYYLSEPLPADQFINWLQHANAGIKTGNAAA